MRRSDREIKEFEAIVDVMERCDVCRVALKDEDYPYILPLNFGMEVVDTKIALYFHGATEGKKYDLIKKDNRVCFEMDCSHKLVTELETGNCTMEYESVIGRGRLTIVPDEEKSKGLSSIMKHYHEADFPYNTNVITCTTIMKLEVEEITGKARFVKK